tara:strand:- start:11787 stop:12035 length:249 start_codon:yes stop_codon:yes gene_type:complete
MSSINNKYVIAVSHLEINMIIKSLRLYDDLSIRFKNDEKKGVVRMIIDDLLQIEQKGPQIGKECKIEYNEADIVNMICEECE